MIQVYLKSVIYYNTANFLYKLVKEAVNAYHGKIDIGCAETEKDIIQYLEVSLFKYRYL